jgi:hypothetical protein
MKGSPKRASNSPRQSARAPVVLDLPTVQKMLPLVRRIVADLLAAEQDNGSLLWELEGLDRNRRTLTWPERQRRYQIQDEITRFTDRRKALEGELGHLGVHVVDAVHGRVGFPTIVNAKPAFFSWQPEETDVGYWHFVEDTDVRRPIPQSWLHGLPAGAAAAKRKRASGL